MESFLRNSESDDAIAAERAQGNIPARKIEKEVDCQIAEGAVEGQAQRLIDHGFERVPRAARTLPSAIVVVDARRRQELK
jgi:hypothetical protein